MGGVGSGRPPAADRKVCLEDCVSVTAQQLQQSYRWAPEPGADQAAVTWLSLGEDWTFQEREAQLRRVQGRWLVVCPQCDRTVAALYLPRGKKDYQCRHCYDLTYRSRQTWDKRVAAGVRDPWFLKEDRPPESILEVRVIGATLERFRRRRERAR